MYAIDELVTQTFLQHWGLTRWPFPKIAEPDHAFPDQRLNAALTRLQQLLLTREVGVVVGEAGSGKSTLLDLFLNTVSHTRYRVIHIPIPQTRPRELYRSIASALGVNTSWFGADALKVIDLLTYSYLESNRPNVLLIDEAHILTPTCLNELRLLTNATGKNEAVLTLILFGQPTLSTTLKLPTLIPLAQRIGAWIPLGGLNETESCHYIDWQVQAAGGQPEIFPLSTQKAIFRRTQGIPRMINRLALESLHQGCLEGSQVITEELFTRVCKNLGPHLAN
ncbi:P-loop containing nucleoside triphosphate hydrolase [Acididesulfobacillus acetoxydans]|uniref:AAA domain n=1 Tax=Acididesulfobacillus acetoxydans TaxID=1561005 RepID=A0A8S0WMT2_9FIRM|nr:AAA family ATPase [Acididesulfobacillus acetoxydans]CAA7600764.1 P-loop containing nucleoside triphosphate hydrolase [Acididesulfobacillus acetoxydans]CEJ08974.1 AAA domain [Acididesulfobacillus acetoxydans]